MPDPGGIKMDLNDKNELQNSPRSQIETHELGHEMQAPIRTTIQPPLGTSGPLLGPPHPGATWKALRSVEWRAFIYEHGSFMLHIPTSTVLETDLDTAQYIMRLHQDPMVQDQGSIKQNSIYDHDHDEGYAAGLEELAASFPKIPPRNIQVNIAALSLNMAQGCNLRCTYCFAGEGDYGVKGMMSFETAQKAISMLSEGKKNFHLIFFGGEPLLNFGVIQQIVDWTQTLPVKFTYGMTTNGTLLSEEKVKWLHDYDVAVTISYDGKGIHAKNRLNKDKISNSEILVEKKLKNFETQLSTLKSFRLRSTITRDVLDLTEEAIVQTLHSFNYRLSVSRHADKAERLAFTLADIDRLTGIMARVIDRLLESKDYEKLMRFEAIMGFVRSLHQGKTRQISCGAGVNYLTVSVKGGFHLCHRFNEDETERYGDIHTGVNVEGLQEIAQVRHAQKEPCKSCFVREFCAGGCFHEHKLAHGSKFVLDETFCRLLGSEITIAMRVYTYLTKHAPEVLEFSKPLKR